MKKINREGSRCNIDAANILVDVILDELEIGLQPDERKTEVAIASMFALLSIAESLAAIADAVTRPVLFSKCE